MRTLVGLVKGIGWFRAGRSVPILLGHDHVRVYWLSLPLIQFDVFRWGTSLYLGPTYAFLAVEVVLARRPVRLSANTVGWGDWQ